MAKFALIWQSPDLDVGIEVYEGVTKEEATLKWLDETEDCTLIGIIAGDPEVLEWYP